MHFEHNKKFGHTIEFINVGVNPIEKKGIKDTNLNHFLKPKEQPFLKEERDDTTLLFGGLTWKHERLLQGYFEGLGYKCQPLPNPDLSALQFGKEYSDPGCCNPTYFTSGALLKYLKELEKNGLTKKEIIKKYVFFSAGSCGPCRFGMYEMQYRLALKNAGFDGFRVLVFQQIEGLDQSKDNAGLDMNPDFFLGILLSFIIADLVNDIAFQLRPYEVNSGSVDSALNECIEYAYFSLKNSKHKELPSIIKKIFKNYNGFVKYINIAYKTLNQIFFKEHDDIIIKFKEIFSKIELNYLQPKPIVKIIGEFWAQTTEGDGNFNMHKFLENEGAQVFPEAIGNWILYISHQGRLVIRDKIHLLNFKKLRLRNLKKLIVNIFEINLLLICEKLFRYKYNHFRKILNSKPNAYAPQDYLRKLAENYFNPRIEGGEGHLEIGKTMYYTQNKLCHMFVSLKPFGCMPSLQSDGVMSLITSLYPDILFIPIETSGEGSVNALSRVQMILTEAKEKAFKEFVQVKENYRLNNKNVEELSDNNSNNQSFLKFKNNSEYISTAAKYIEIKFKK